MNKAIEKEVDNIFNGIKNILEKNILTSEDKFSLVSFYNLHFYYSRYHNKSWNNLIIKKINTLKDKIEQDRYKKLFSFSMVVDENLIHYKNIIEKTKVVPSLFFNFEQNGNSSTFLFNYKRYLFTKHFNSCVFHFFRFTNFKQSEDLFNKINTFSVSGKIFIEENNSIVFSIPQNRAATFLFYDNSKLLSFDVSVDQKIDSLNLLPHFLISHNSFNKNFNELKKQLLNQCNKSHYNLVKEITNKNVDYLSNLLKINCNHLICFENDLNYSLLPKEELSTFKTIGIENTFFEQNTELFISSDIHKNVFNHLIYSSKKISQDIISRDFGRSYLIKLIILNKIEDFLNNFNKIDKEYFIAAIENTFLNLNTELNKQSEFNFNAFKYAAIKSNIEKENDYMMLYSILTIEKQFNQLPNIIKNNPFIKKTRAFILKPIIFNIILNGKINNEKHSDILNELQLYHSGFNKRKIKTMLKNI